MSTRKLGAQQAHLRLLRCSTNVKEICWRAPMELDDVHGSHRQAGAIHHAPDAAVQANVVEVVLASRHFSARLVSFTGA